MRVKKGLGDTPHYYLGNALYVADYNKKVQQNINSLPKSYHKIRRFEKGPHYGFAQNIKSLVLPPAF